MLEKNYLTIRYWEVVVLNNYFFPERRPCTFASYSPYPVAEIITEM